MSDLLETTHRDTVRLASRFENESEHAAAFPVEADQGLRQKVTQGVSLSLVSSPVHCPATLENIVREVG